MEMTEKISRTYQVEEGRLPWLAGQLARLAKRAAKLGVSPPGYTLGEPYEGKEGVRYIPVTLSGEAPKYAGWTFAATLERLEGGEVLVRSFSEEPLPAKYRSGETSGECDHCKTVRNRTETFVVKHESGEYRQVGRQCIRDFLGHADPDRLAAIANLLSEVLGLGEGEGYDGGGERVLSLGYYLPYVAATMNAYGWCSRSKAREGGSTPTADTALEHADPSNELLKLAQQGKWTRLEVTPADTARAQVAREWASELSDEEVLKSDYLHNLRALTRAGSVTYRTAGYAASIIIACEKAQDRVRAAQARPESNYLGTVGKREVFKSVTVERVLELERAYGVTYLHLMTDAAGNDLKWFGSSRLVEKEGETVDMKATVKKHEEYKGRKQTVVSRAVKLLLV